jgi:hypothetical protein
MRLEFRAAVDRLLEDRGDPLKLSDLIVSLKDVPPTPQVGDLAYRPGSPRAYPIRRVAPMGSNRKQWVLLDVEGGRWATVSGSSLKPGKWLIRNWSNRGEPR